MKRKRMLEEWNTFRTMVYPLGIPDDEQRKQLRMAFYGGASALLAALLRDLAPDEDPKPEDMQMLRDVQKELTEFAAEMKAQAVEHLRAGLKP